MCNGEERGSCAHGRKATAGTAMKLELRRAAMPDHFNVAPQHLLSVTGAKRFHRGFLCREAPGKMDGWKPSPLTVSNFAVSEDAAEKTVAESLDCRRDARNVRRV